jgi:DNA-binding transcriptional regulator LsrR (DeoR family)
MKTAAIYVRVMITDRRSGMSLTQVAKKHAISRASVCRLVKEAKGDQESLVPKFALKLPAQANAASSAQ